MGIAPAWRDTDQSDLEEVAVGGRNVTDEERGLIEKAGKYQAGGGLGNAGGDVIMRRGKGGRVWDVSGNEYIDFMLGSGPMLVGHVHPEVVAAVRKQIEQGTTFFANNEHAVQLAEEIVKAVPCADKVRFCSSGAEATFYAMRTARAFRKRDKILKFEGGFHGMNDYAMMSMGPTEPLDFPHPTPDSPGIPRSIQEEVLIAPFNDIETTSAIIDRYHDELGGVIVEPFRGVIPPKPGFLQGLREVTERYEIPLIFDEVVTGFRLAYGGAQEYYGVTPDLTTLGKAVGGGYPLTALVGRDEIMAQFDRNLVGPGEFLPQVGTLSGNPVASVAGLATLNILRREGTYERLFATGNQIKDDLQRYLQEAEIPAQVTGDGPLFDVYFTDTEVTDHRSTLGVDKQMQGRFNELLRDRGIWKNAIKFYISAAHTQDDVDQTIEAIRSAVDELRG